MLLLATTTHRQQRKIGGVSYPILPYPRTLPIHRDQRGDSPCSRPSNWTFPLCNHRQKVGSRLCIVATLPGDNDCPPEPARALKH
jgi:hypothetical protein